MLCCRCLLLLEQPCDLATLPDGEVAVTTDSKVLYFISVGAQISVTARIETQRIYSGVAAHTDDTLIVSSCRGSSMVGMDWEEENREGFGEQQHACVDVIDKSGLVVWTVLNGANVDWLRSPSNLCFVNRFVYIAEYYENTVYKVETSTGQLEEVLTHPDMRAPRQICADESGNLFVASEYGQCVLVRSPAGEWRKILTTHDHSRHGFDHPSGVCITSEGGLIVAWTKTNHGYESELVGYQM